MDRRIQLIILAVVGVGCVARGSPVKQEDFGLFWQLTDVHYDANYSQYPSPEQLCHSAYEDRPRGPSPESGNGHFGDYNCDSPWILVQSAIQAMTTLNKEKPDFILWSGDSVAHVPDSDINMSGALDLIHNVTVKLSSTFPSTPIYPCLGNHDTWPTNQHPPGADAYYTDILQTADWQQILNRGEQEQFKQGGFYAIKTPHGLRIVSLNSNLWYNMDTLVANLTDPAGQLSWLESVLQQARKDGEKVLISTHVPPGVLARAPMKWFYPEFNVRYLDILKKYSDIIQTSIYGHEHTDSFRVVRDEKGNPLSALFMAPAVTPWRSTVPGLGANNPSLRLYTYNRQTGAILDYTQYYFNLSLANSQPGTPWQQEYRAREVYNLKSLGPRDLQQLADTMATEQDLFNKYYLYNSVSYDTAKCEGDCRRKHLCGIEHADYTEYDKCVANNNVDEDSMVTEDDGDLSLFMHHHRRHRKFHHVPQFMFIVIIMLVIVIVILFVILAIVCCRRRHVVTYMRQPRYVLINPDET